MYSKNIDSIAKGGIILGLGVMLGSLGLHVATTIVIVSLGLFVANKLSETLPKENRLKYGSWSLLLPTSALFILISWQALLSLGLVLDERKVNLYLVYAYEWNYRGSTNESGNMLRRITEPLKRNYTKSEIPVQLEVVNENLNFPLFEVILHVYFPKYIVVRKDGNWQEMYPNEHYYVVLENISKAHNVPSGKGPTGMLFMKFPSPGIYKISHIINSLNVGSIERSFDIILE